MSQRKIKTNRRAITPRRTPPKTKRTTPPTVKPKAGIGMVTATVCELVPDGAA